MKEVSERKRLEKEKRFREDVMEEERVKRDI